MKKGHYMITDLIAELKISLKKVPTVPNYNNIIKIVPALEQWVKDNGDLEFDPADMEKFLMAKQMNR